MKESEIKEFLDEKVDYYNRISFIDSDPVQIPHRYTKKGDIEIAGFLAATIAWGNRKMILRNANRMMELLDDSPYDYILNAGDEEFDVMESFVHRTFNSDDFLTFIEGLNHLYRNKNGLEGIFEKFQTHDSLQPAIHELKREFFTVPHLLRTRKHLPDPLTGSAWNSQHFLSYN